jgi:hypothetical protein
MTKTEKCCQSMLNAEIMRIYIIHMAPHQRRTPFSGQKCLKERGFLMAKYDVEFKKKCIKAYEEGKQLPNVAGVLPISMIKFVTQWRLLFKEQGERAYRMTMVLFLKSCKIINRGEYYQI